ncbi:ADP-ribose pyrophosphatase YjhB (NUDIX family) [Lentzea atacamensis]|uniref:ADP-ribose pyrophosphatase YjhB (NUDIX family) n=1 Tax=Lentzea atacamensis TaxID=531938 RepID=A0A316HV85_9PSEU|nr:NUDIX domain-containing protein [Lentzea atacamensis]PWK82241.1 ADP-ribose pyrophosphatase YjhB (NUDIX family) [Lentzea atacamensis]
MDLVREWTARKACALQHALRETNDSFAARLGIPSRTVVSWHQKPDLVPRKAQQQLLDVLLERATASERARFAAELAEDTSAAGFDDSSASGHVLRVAIAVVANDHNVLMVQRREDNGSTSWQFPAGMIKPGASAATTAIRETLSETGVHCRVTRHLGSRLHPITQVYCEYLLCEYLGGEAQNMDVVENVSVIWTPSDRLTRFIPAETIFPPILDALEVRNSE